MIGYKAEVLAEVARNAQRNANSYRCDYHVYQLGSAFRAYPHFETPPPEWHRVEIVKPEEAR